MGFKLQILPSFFKKKITYRRFQRSSFHHKRVSQSIYYDGYLTRISNRWRGSQRAYRTNLIFALDILCCRGRFLLRVITSERGVLTPGSERKILVEASRARSTPKKMWKKRKEIGNERLEPRGTRAIPRENCDSFFREPASGFSHAFLRNYRCQDYREGRLLRLLFCSRIW